jgi:hypothetical protein
MIGFAFCSPDEFFKIFGATPAPLMFDEMMYDTDLSLIISSL